MFLKNVTICIIVKKIIMGNGFEQNVDCIHNVIFNQSKDSTSKIISKDSTSKIIETIPQTIKEKYCLKI